MAAPVAPVAVPALAPDPVEVAPISPPAVASTEDNPLAATNSPWLKEKAVVPELPPPAMLPSAAVAAAPAPAKAVEAPAPAGGSRTAMTVGLAVAAVALIAAVVYFVMADKKTTPDDPAKVNVGSEQRDYDMSEGDKPQPSAAPSATEAPKPEPPKPKPFPKITPKPATPKPDDNDIYD